MIRIANSGYGVNFNQIVENGDFVDSTKWGGKNATISVSNGVCTFTATAQWGGLRHSIMPITAGHIYIIKCDLKATTAGSNMFINLEGSVNLFLSSRYIPLTTDWQTYTYKSVAFSTGGNFYLVFGDKRSADRDAFQVKNVYLTDITQDFGAGNEPTTVAEFRKMYSNDYYDYTLSQWQWAKKGKITSYPTPCFGVDFNQKFNSASPNISTRSGVSCTRNNNVFTFSGTATAEAIFSLVYIPPIGHKILYSPTIIRTKNLPNWAISQNYLGNIGEPLIRVANRSNCVLYAHFVAGHITDGLSFLLNIFDLTQMYGEGNEPATVEEFRSKFPDTYYPFTVSEMRYIDEKTSYALLPIEHHVVGIMNKVELLNLWNDNYLSKHDLSEGVQMWAATVISSSNINNVFKPSTTYRFECDVEVLSLPEDKVLYDSTCGFLIYKQGGSNRYLMRVDVRYFTGHYSGTFTTPSSIEGYSLLGYTGRWTNSAVTEAYYGTVKFTNIKLIEGSLLYHGVPTYNYLQRLLPTGFVQLDYIESTGTQWINTVYIPNQDTKVDIKVMLRPNLTSGNYCIFSGRTYLDTNSYSLFFLIVNNSVARFDYDDTQLPFSIDFSSLVNTDLEIFTDKNKCYFNGVLKAQINYSNFTSAYPMLIGASYADGANNNFACMRTYFCKIGDNDLLARNLIPCYRFSDGIEGLYDTVEKQFHTNQGTGRFLRGKEIDSGNLLDLSKFVQGYPSNTAFDRTTKRTFTENTYIKGIASNNYYSPTTVTDVYINEQTLSLYGRSGYGIAFVLNLKKNKKYKAYWSGNSVQGIYLMYYSTDGTFISSTNIGSSGANRVEFTTLSDFEYALMTFVPMSETTATFSNISLHEAN